MTTEPAAVVYIGLGANMGDAAARIREAVRELAGGLDDVEVSSLYRSRPEDGSDQPDYLNAVVRGRTNRSARDMLVWANSLEAHAGRTRPYPGAPRTLDVDLVFYGDTVSEGPELTLPHPRWARRPFVVIPLLEIDPGWRDPVSGRTVAEVAEDEEWAEDALVRVLDGSGLMPVEAR